jgi:hypothetical protein
MVTDWLPQNTRVRIKDREWLTRHAHDTPFVVNVEMLEAAGAVARVEWSFDNTHHTLVPIDASFNRAVREWYWSPCHFIVCDHETMAI